MACTNGKCVLAGNVRKLREAGMEALREGDTGQAETLLRRSVELSEASGGVPTATANSTYRLALALHEAGRSNEAAEHFERALALVRDRAGSESKLYRKILCHFAEALLGRAQPEWACAAV